MFSTESRVTSRLLGNLTLFLVVEPKRPRRKPAERTPYIRNELRRWAVVNVALLHEVAFRLLENECGEGPVGEMGSLFDGALREPKE